MARWFKRKKSKKDKPALGPTPRFDDSPSGAPTPLESLLEGRKEDLPEEQALRARANEVRGLPIPPQELIDWVGGGDEGIFKSVGMEVTLELISLCGLQPGDRVLEPGCGCGRNARYIAPYLDPARGRFDGFDVARPPIDWATQNITSVYPNVRFEFADIQNPTYNPSGSVASDEFVFPYEDGCFDLVFLPSVFTHMTRGEFEHYIAEIRRVLKPGGRLLAWHFLLNEISRRGVDATVSAIKLEPYDEVSWVQSREEPSLAVAYDEEYVLGTLEAAGLRPQFIAHGEWSGRRAEGLTSFQDRLLARKL